MGALDICNDAISHVGQGTAITNFDTDQTPAGVVCRRFYPKAVRKVLRDGKGKWGFARKTGVALAPLNDPDVDGDFNDEYKWAYGLPSDCEYLHRIRSGIRNDTDRTKVVYERASVAGVQAILTNQDEAKVDYTFRNEETTQYPIDFEMVVGWYLASLIAPRLPGLGNGNGLAKDMLTMYYQELSAAFANDLNEQYDGQEPDGELATGHL